MKKSLVVEIIVGIALLSLLIVGVIGVQAYRQPLAASLNVVLAPTSTTNPSTQATTVPTVAPQAAASADKTCGMSGTMTVLMIGRDEKYWNPPFGADAIRLIKVDFSAKKMDVFAFQRDLKLSTPSLEKKYQVKEYKLGPTYVLIRDKEGNQTPGDDIKATNEIAQILYDNFGVVPDHYATIEEGVLPDMVDKVGGVNVTVDQAIKDGSLDLKTGEQTFDGKTSMLYSRYLVNGQPASDEWGRMDRQAVVFKALAVKLLEPANFVKIPDFYKEINKSVVTDLSPEQIRSLACMAKEIQMSNVNFKTIAKDQLNILNDGTMVIRDMDAVRKTLTELFGTK